MRAAVPAVAAACIVATSFGCAPREAPVVALLGLAMLAVAAVDRAQFRIPDVLVACAGALALLRAVPGGGDEILAVLVGAGLAALPLALLMLAYRRWRGIDGLGFGDVKLAAAGGAWLAPLTWLAVLEGAALAALGAYVLAARMRRRALRRRAALPFGVFLAPAIWLGALVEAMQRF